MFQLFKSEGLGCESTSFLNWYTLDQATYLTAIDALLYYRFPPFQALIWLF